MAWLTASWVRCGLLLAGPRGNRHQKHTCAQRTPLLLHSPTTFLLCLSQWGFLETGGVVCVALHPVPIGLCEENAPRPVVGRRPRPAAPPRTLQKPPRQITIPTHHKQPNKPHAALLIPGTRSNTGHNWSCANESGSTYTTGTLDPLNYR